tara:strand:- start:30 stop:563 length:534 start_codon:yes stop_codon:yes gene_type:complete
MKQIFNKKALKNHFKNVTIDDFFDMIISLNSEGKNSVNVLNQIELAKMLRGKFVGHIINDHDIVANGIKIELKCNVNQAMDWGATVGFGSFHQKEDWDLLVHWVPSSFNKYLNEDKFTVFKKSEFEILKKESNDSGGFRYTSKIFNPDHKITRNKLKLEFVKKRIMNLQELKQLIYG